MNTPAWLKVAAVVALLWNLLGCIGLLLRRKWAFSVLVLSLLGILVQDSGPFVLADGARLAGPVVMAMQMVVLAVGIGLVWLSREGVTRGWLVDESSPC